MMKSVLRKAGELLPFDPARRGYHVVYRPEVVNWCPSCGRSHWLVGRASAECGFCATALPLADTGMMGVGTYRQGHPVAAL